ncbi:MAG TPA: diguanylate cyclase [bacterium]|nr:diguanylate cyclase [bacterium]
MVECLMGDVLNHLEREETRETGRPRILVVDDEEIMLSMLVEHLQGQSYEVDGCYNGAEAMKRIDQYEYAVLITDLVMTPIQGQEIVAYLKKHHPDTEAIVMTAYASVDRAVEAIHQHVFDFVEKPFSLRRIDVTVSNAISKYRLSLENRKLVEELARQNERLEERIRNATQDLQDLTVKDGLTGLNNYRFYQSIIVAEISRCIRYGRDLSLAVLDLDFFKIYNDQHGHQAGNEALCLLAQILESNSRESDHIIRYGGEEFVVVFPETGKKEAAKNVERTSEALRKASLTVDSPTGLGFLTLSAGLATCPADATEAESLMRAADMALYDAKNQGRNRIVLADESHQKARQGTSE